jgi:dihydroorotase
MGADMHGYNVKIFAGDDERSKTPFFGVAPFNLTNAMSKLLALGMDFSAVVATVTCNAAKMLGMSGEIGCLRVGGVADISVVGGFGGGV